MYGIACHHTHTPFSKKKKCQKTLRLIYVSSCCNADSRLPSCCSVQYTQAMCICIKRHHSLYILMYYLYIRNLLLLSLRGSTPPLELYRNIDLEHKRATWTTWCPKTRQTCTKIQLHTKQHCSHFRPSRSLLKDKFSCRHAFCFSD